MFSKIETRMEYIQQVFLGVTQFLQQKPDLETLINFLDAESPEYRSIAYESASMEIALNELTMNQNLAEWNRFYHRHEEQHAFHMAIGLGWAFAKVEISPAFYLKQLDPLTCRMLFDGIGYFFGLFRGRRTIKHQQIPDLVNDEQLPGFDQGLGRRLWYLVKGNEDALAPCIQGFMLHRHPDLWRGVGVACGYVGGCEKNQLEKLAYLSGKNKAQFRVGIALSVISRVKSKSMTRDLELACQAIFNLPVENVLVKASNLLTRINSESGNLSSNWNTHLEEEFS
jgi:enediyne biosynthesis protein E3